MKKLKYFSKNGLRQLLFGNRYVEADITAAHPTMAATAMRWAGVESRAWQELAEDPGGYRSRTVAEYRRIGVTVQESDVKRAGVILLNGGSTTKWARMTIGREIVTDALSALRSGVRTFRERATGAYPDISAAVEEHGKAKTRDEMKTAVVHAVMTGLEDRVLASMETAAARTGWDCAALMGDGMLVKPADGRWPTEWETLCRAWEGTVLSHTGVRVRLKFKTLDGRNADPGAPRVQRPLGA